MRNYYVLLGVGVLLASCSKTPGVNYPLSAERLAWQPYREGQVVRYANSRTAAVRTYAVTKVFDRLEKERVGINWVPLLPSREPDEYQNVTVTMQRTDSVGASFTVVDLVHSGDPSYANGFFLARAGWETLGPGPLPLDELNQGVSFDTTQYRGVKVVPTIKLGSAIYSNVLEIKNLYAGASSLGLPTTTRIYYAKQRGVLAFEDKATGLWSLVP
ncbi:MAG: hypothetical protein ACRYF0_02290 [Janthinobacterium lividum]